MGTDERPEPNAESGPSTSPARGDIVDTFWDIPPISFDENDGGLRRVTMVRGLLRVAFSPSSPALTKYWNGLLRVRRILLAMPFPLPMLWLLPR